MLHSDVTGQGLGTLIPDAILHAGGQVQCVVDAKYKSLHPSASAPNGPQREDLYQMAAYLGLFIPPVGSVSWGVLAYPLDPARPSIPQAEQLSPWSMEGGRKVAFTSLPHVASDAVAKLRALIAPIASERSVWRAQA
jgi:5-methylcytosine-specific restriction enzyme subunit McrC